MRIRRGCSHPRQLSAICTTGSSCSTPLSSTSMQRGPPLPPSATDHGSIQDATFGMLVTGDRIACPMLGPKVCALDLRCTRADKHVGPQPKRRGVGVGPMPFGGGPDEQQQRLSPPLDSPTTVLCAQPSPWDHPPDGLWHPPLMPVPPAPCAQGGTPALQCTLWGCIACGTPHGKICCVFGIALLQPRLFGRRRTPITPRLRTHPCVGSGQAPV
mmetsp:Transcript_30002/g.48203  ORF Transcript_30002/g.48203 Transcript_30002/m.48203 type:complete len:214 (+) Transcript_30002:1268-1909(+)